MFRKSALAMAMWGALAAQSALALGLGDIELKSALNQPLRAEVQLLSVTEKELQELRVALASAEIFQQAGIDRPSFLSNIRFEPVRKPDGSAVIQLTSREAVREPFLDFMLEVVWANGKLVRAYTVLVDPPVTMPAPAPTAQLPVTRAPAPTPARATAPRPATTTPAADVGTHSGDTYGPTGRNDTLWNIAAKVRPEGVGMEQAMLGLLNANPSAFIGHNINNLKAGYVLRIPDRAEFTSISTADASAEVRTQNREWREGRVRPTPAETAAPMPAPAPAPAGSKLELTAPDEEAAAAGAAAVAGEGDNLDALRRELVLATEATEVQRAQSEQLESRLQVLEEQIAKMQRLIELKDDQLALLANQAGEEASATGIPAPETAPGEPSGVDALEAELFQGEGTAPPAETEAEGSLEEAMPGEAVPGEDMAATPESEPVPEPVMQATPPQSARVEPPPFEESRSLLDRILANPLWLGAGAVVLALLVLLGLRRRSASEPEFQESILQEREERPTRASAPVVPDTPRPAESESESRPRESDSSLLSEFATSDLGAIQNQSEADPLAEADVYLAYGRYQQAEDLIRDALEAEPERDDFNLKLFEIYAAAQNRSGFDAHAEQVLARLENQEHPLWLKVADMGRELSPDNPLYQPGGAPTTNRNSAADAPPPGVEDNSLDFDLGLGDDDAGLTSQEPPLGDMDFDLDTAAEEPKPAPGEDEPMEFDLGGEEERKPDTAESSNDLDFDLGDLDLGGADLDEEDQGEGLLSDMDEVSTKLDLARAYIDMGDPDGARSILEEVLQEGNETQQDEARELLGQL
ncbi:MAG: hypothetical protein OQL11_05275 [Gammaproteobacteria bacterium]|nr:hypothetical protein [Gammaproteobacteria bacterium]